MPTRFGGNKNGLKLPSQRSIESNTRLKRGTTHLPALVEIYCSNSPEIAFGVVLSKYAFDLSSYCTSHK